MFLILMAMVVMAGANRYSDPAAKQLEVFRKKHLVPVGILTTSAGRPIPYSEASGTLNSRLLYNEYVIESLASLNRERISVRVVHVKAGGVFGYFEVTNDISHITKACLFSKVGKRTPVAARFSPIVANKRGSDLSRDVRGFVLKFYTQEGNYDLVGFNQPVFVVKDPRLFTTFVHSQKGNPATNINDVNVFWDFLTLRPETFNLYLRVFADTGIPNGYRHMPGFGIHTFQVENSVGDVYPLICVAHL